MDVAASNAEAIAAIKRRCHELRVTPGELCEQAGVSRQTLWRGEREPGKMKAGTLGKLEDRLRAIETERAAA